MRASRLSGSLTGNGGDFSLTGRFVSKRKPGRKARNAGKFIVVPAVSKFADGLAARTMDDWEVYGQFKLAFGDVRLEFDVRDSLVTKISADRSGVPLGRPAVRCKQLLDKIRLITWNTEETVAVLSPHIEAMRASGISAELLSDYWTKAVMLLDVGQTADALAAAREGIQILRGHPGQIEIRGSLRELGLRLADALETIDQHHVAADLAGLIGEERPDGR